MSKCSDSKQGDRDELAGPRVDGCFCCNVKDIHMKGAFKKTDILTFIQFLVWSGMAAG